MTEAFQPVIDTSEIKVIKSGRCFGARFRRSNILRPGTRFPMQIHITARHIRLTQPIRDYVEQKVQKAQKYFNHIVWAQVVLAVEKRVHAAEIVLHAGRQTFRSQARGVDLYSAIDLASDKIDAQLKKYKERVRDHHKGKPADLAEIAAEGPGPVRFTVVKQAVRPMSREEAADEMDELGLKFRLFLDEATNQMSVVYRRDDDSYAVLLPVKKNGK